MSENTDFSALEWVKGEISESLRQAQHALEAYVSNPEDSTKMQFCITHLHQVWGTLQMVELEGASLFAAEMEALAQAVLDGKTAAPSEAQEVLMQAFLQLPTYLDNLVSGSKDMPVVLLPMLNDLRSTRGATLMSETVMFNPDLKSGHKVAQQREESAVSDLEVQLQKLRKAYQKSLLSVIKGEAMEKNLEYMGKILARLQKLSGKSQISQIWWISGAMIDGLLAGSIDFSKSVSSLLGAIDRQIKEMVDDHKKTLSSDVSKELAKNLLYYVASSEPSSKRIANVQKAYKLSKALPNEVRQEQSQQARRGLVNEAIVAAVDVLIEDLLNINENLDLVVRSKGKEDHRLKELLPIVKSIAGALHVLALKESRNIMAAQYKILGACVAGKVDDVKSELMGVAGQLLAVESNLNDIAKNGMSGKILIGEISNQEKVSSDQLGNAQKVLLNEAITSIETVKDLFGAMLAADWSHEVLEEAIENLRTVSGSLKIIPLPLASEVLDKSVLYVSERLAKLDKAPEQSELEAFADVLSSVDYFLEKLRTDSRTDTESLLIGAERLAGLGFALENTNAIKAIAATVIEESSDSEVLSDILESAEDEEIRLQAESAAAKLIDQEAEVTSEQVASESTTSTQDETPVQDSDEVEEPVAPATTVVTDASESESSEAQEDDDDNVIDDEIIEIFIEEVGEVQETLNEFLPKWIENNGDEESLTEVRRAFHTLKGSGRMVGATEMGEMAWCIENMLNRLIDNSIKISDALLQAVLDAVDTVPELLELFKQAKNEATERSNEISARAEAISKGESPEPASSPDRESSPELVDSKSDETEVTEPVKETPAHVPAPEYDQEIIDIFSQEALGHTEALKSFTEECRERVGPWVVSDDVLRTMHTLKGCANMAAIEPVAPVVTKAENFVKELRLLDRKANDDVISLIETVCQLTEQVIAELPEVSGDSFSRAENTLEQIANLVQKLLQNDAGDLEGDSGKQERIDSFLKYDFDIIFDGEDFFNDYMDAQADSQSQSEMAGNLQALADECQQISAVAQESELEEISALAAAIAKGSLQAKAQTVAENYVKDLGVAIHRLTEIVDFLAAGQFIKSPAKITNIIQGHIDSYSDVVVQADSIHVPAEEVEQELEENSTEEAIPLAEVSEYDEEDETEAETGLEAESIEQSAADSEQASVPEAMDASENVMDDDIERDSEIVDIFLEEAEELIENSANLLDQWQDAPGDLSIVGELQRDLHTLKGGARMAEFSSIGDLGHELENIYEAVGSRQLATSSELFNLLFRCHDRISEMFTDIRAQGNCYRADDLLAEIKVFVPGAGGATWDLPENEAEQEAPSSAESIDAQDTTARGDDTYEEASEPVASSEQHANEPTLEEVPEPEKASEDNEAVQDIQLDADSDELLDEEDDSELDADLELVEIFLEEAEEIIESSATALEEWRSDSDNPALLEQLQRELHTLKGGARMAQISEIGDFAHEMENIYEGLVAGSVAKSEALTNLLFQCHDRLNEMVVSLKENNSCETADSLLEQLKLALVGKLGDKVEEKQPEQTSSIKLEKNIEPDVIDMFLNDGQELVKQLEGSLLQLQASQNDKDIVKTKELLVALSGAAKLSGFKSLASFCEDFDKLIEEQGSEKANHQKLMEGFKNIQDFIKLLEAARPKTTAVEKAAEKKPAPKSKENKAAPKQKDSQAESIKISADLLENLVNLAGETSINRGRLEVQLSEFAFTIEEISGTIERLQEQLRRLHLETEAQIVFRHEKEGPTDEEVAQMEAEDDDFDPLEMDRYSAIDQLSRSLSESASDLIDLKETLLNKTRDAETLLLQQGRVNTELQEGLMRSRMVPFSRLLPRLRRIVRQVGNELKKPVDLEILNAEGEMDRAVLERMISPIEHMLRNSIAHGIEKADERKKANKPKNGTISIDLGREGSNMLITLKDDGAGVNVDAVRKKAIENGLLDPNVDLPDNEIVEFIFNPGFSTAAEVSQVAGRGVGMDVVASEIKELGGSIETHSVSGSGTSFTIRLPFTVAVNRALMVTIGEDYYAIPLTSIEGVVRISPYELEAYYEEEEPVFNYAGVDYSLQYLGAYMHSHDRPHLLGQTRPLPVLLVQSGEHAVAMHVDSLLGSREIVVKSVGPQLSSVAGISGATILGDGSVVIILDIHSMIRGAIAQKTSTSVQTDVMESKKKDRPTQVMVVDDSVTVRKVTSRLLERNGMEVVLAKDGVDAITQLQEIKPDVMLLDIEMPRMDGFEVATLVRHDERLKDVPIIMITSRTGEKHKQRAMDIGVNRYMGKPFQEGTLLSTIEELMSEKQGEKV